MEKKYWIPLLWTTFACNGSDKVISVDRTPPEVAIQEPSSGSTFYVGQIIRFRAFVQSSTDVDLIDMTHQWSSGSQTVCEPEAVPEDGYAFCEWTFETTGEHSMTVSVNGSQYGQAQATVELTLEENAAPMISIVSPNSTDLYASDELIVFEAFVDDAEEPAENLQIEVSSNIDGDLGVTGNASSSGEFTAGATLSSGQHLVTMIVEDSYGKTDQATVDFRVYDHGPPSADGVSVSPAAPITTDDLSVSVSGWADNDNSPEMYRYRWFLQDTDGNMVEEANELTSIFPSSRTTKGDLIQVEVTPYNEYGDGAVLLSSVVLIENAPPSQPTVSILPSSPEPNESLECIASDVIDVDNDVLSYSYTWSQNGMTVATTTSVVDASMTEDGDIWICEVIASDGQDNSLMGSSSVTVSDTVAPSEPVIDSLDPFRNNPDVTLTGACEAGCAMIMYCSDTTYSWTDSLTCDSSGSFSYTTTFSNGTSSSCYATCEDTAGNVSGNSNVVSSEICQPSDTYELSGIGNSSSDAVNQWAAIPDDGTTITIAGNILENDTDDWFVISSSDDVGQDLADGLDYYRVDIELTDGASDYSFVVYKGGYSSNDLECPNGTVSYSDFNQDNGEGVLDDGSPRGIPTETRACGSASPTLNECEDNSTDYYINVFRNTTVGSCQAYELTISNGVW